MNETSGTGITKKKDLEKKSHVLFPDTDIFLLEMSVTLALPPRTYFGGV